MNARAEYDERRGSGTLVSDGRHRLQLSVITNNEPVVDVRLHGRPRSTRALQICIDWKEQSSGMEGLVQGLVLSAQRDTVQLEAHGVPGARVSSERAVEAEPDFFFAHDVYVALEPVPALGVVRLY